jgi:hypothetical protein
MTRKADLWPLTIDHFDKMPREAREAMANSAILGNGSPSLKIARAPGPVMAERIRTVDREFLVGSNDRPLERKNPKMLNAILQGTAT